jgi:hypothetical protein
MAASFRSRAESGSTWWHGQGGSKVQAKFMITEEIRLQCGHRPGSPHLQPTATQQNRRLCPPEAPAADEATGAGRLAMQG